MYRRKLATFIIVASIIRLFVANTIEFGNDEVYYYIYALHLQWNYFDHPPVIALLIRLSTCNLIFTDELFVRLGAIIGAAAGTWFCYSIGKYLRNERTGYYAAILYNTSIYTCVIAGIFILPDSPQVVFWLASLWALVKMILAGETGGKIKPGNWLLFGLLTGVCIMCKVHGIFLWVGLGLYIIVYNRRMLANPWLYIAALLTAFIISPILIWNVNNHFITYTYHSDRVEVHKAVINSSDFFQALLGQVAYNNPINIFLIIVSLFAVFRKQLLFVKPLTRILMLTGLPIVIVVMAISLFNSVLPHWSGPGFLTLLFFAAAYLDKKINVSLTGIPKILKAAMALVVVTLIGGFSIINYYPGSFSFKNNELGEGDFTLDLSGWKSFEKAYEEWLGHHEEYSHLKLVSHKWFPASHIEYYVARPLNNEVTGVGKLNDLHTYAWLNKYRRNIKPGENALIIIPSNYRDDVRNYYGNYFSTIDTLQTFIAKRNGKLTRKFFVFLAKGYNGKDEVHLIDVK